MLTEVADGVWVRQSAWVWTNSIVVRGKGELILVDPGIDGCELNQLADDLDRLGVPVVAGFCTHPHAWARMETGSPAPTSRTWSRSKDGRGLLLLGVAGGESPGGGRPSHIALSRVAGHEALERCCGDGLQADHPADVLARGAGCEPLGGG